MERKRTATRRKPASTSTTKSRGQKKWSGAVTKHSNALDLEGGVFKKKDPKKIALSLKRSAEHSKRKKGSSYRSAMSMLNFYINRAGKGLTSKERQPLEKAKGELRKIFHKADK
jgi:hypothetical protein